MTEAKKPKKTNRADLPGGRRLVQQREEFWNALRDNPSLLDAFKDRGLPGAELIALDAGVEYPAGTELESLVRNAEKEILRLGEDLKVVIGKAACDSHTKKGLTKTIDSYAAIWHRYGALLVQFELRVIDQFFADKHGTKRGESRRKQGPRETRLALIERWIDLHAPKAGSLEELYTSRKRIEEWLNHQKPKPYVPSDPKKMREDLKEVFGRRRPARLNVAPAGDPDP
jgi:hypothetical protein